MKLIVGLDVSSTELDVCFLTDDDRVSLLKEAGFENDQIGATQIKEFILHYVNEMNIDQIIIGMEATSLYNFHPPRQVFPLRPRIECAQYVRLR